MNKVDLLSFTDTQLWAMHITLDQLLEDVTLEKEPQEEEVEHLNLQVFEELARRTGVKVEKLHRSDEYESFPVYTPFYYEWLREHCPYSQPGCV